MEHHGSQGTCRGDRMKTLLQRIALRLWFAMPRLSLKSWRAVK